MVLWFSGAACSSGSESCSGVECGQDLCAGGGCLDSASQDVVHADSQADSVSDTALDGVTEVAPDIVVLPPIAEVCAAESCQPTEVTVSPCKPQRMLMDDVWLYWMDRCWIEGYGEEDPVYRMPVGGGPVEEMDISQVQMAEVQLLFQTEDELYSFSTGCCVTGYGFSVNRASKAQGKWEWLVDLSMGKTVDYVAVAGDTLYYSMADYATGPDRNTLYEVPMDQGTQGQTHLGTVDVYNVFLMLADEDNVYVVGDDPDSWSDGRVYSVSRSTGQATLLAQLSAEEHYADGYEPRQGTWEQDDSSLFFFFGGSLLKVSKTGGGVTVLSRQTRYMPRLSLYGDYVYFSEYGSIDVDVQFTNGSIWAVSKSGGTPTLLASGQNGPLGIAAGPTGLYWINSEDQQLMHLAP